MWRGPTGASARGCMIQTLGPLLPDTGFSASSGASLEGEPSGWPSAPVHVSLPHFMSQVWTEVSAGVGRWD